MNQKKKKDLNDNAVKVYSRDHECRDEDDGK